jgi:hypothetical protein
MVVMVLMYVEEVVAELVQQEEVGEEEVTDLL